MEPLEPFKRGNGIDFFVVNITEIRLVIELSVNIMTASIVQMEYVNFVILRYSSS